MSDGDFRVAPIWKNLRSPPHTLHGLPSLLAHLGWSACLSYTGLSRRNVCRQSFTFFFLLSPRENNNGSAVNARIVHSAILVANYISLIRSSFFTPFRLSHALTSSLWAYNAYYTIIYRSNGICHRLLQYALLNLLLLNVYFAQMRKKSMIQLDFATRSFLVLKRLVTT